MHRPTTRAHTDTLTRYARPDAATQYLCNLAPRFPLVTAGNALATRLADHATVVVELEHRLNVVLQRRELLVPEEVLDEREDALARRRVRRDGEGDACGERPRWAGVTV